MKVSVKRLGPGCYELPDGRNIVRTEGMGPEGGKRWSWEVVYFDGSNWNIDNNAPCTETLREMREQLAA